MPMLKRSVNSIFFSFSLSLSLSLSRGREEYLQKSRETPKITCHKAFFFRLYPGVCVKECLFQDAELFEHSFREHSFGWTGGAEEGVFWGCFWTQTDSGRLGTRVMSCPCRWPQTETAVSILQEKGQIRSGAPIQQEVEKKRFISLFIHRSTEMLYSRGQDLEFIHHKRRMIGLIGSVWRDGHNVP